MSSTPYIIPLSAGVFLKIASLLPKFINSSNDDISRSIPIWTLFFLQSGLSCGN